MMGKGDGARLFEEQLGRIKSVTGKRTQVELAGFFGVKQSAVHGAKRRGKIPSNWLVLLTLTKHINPNWILSGQGPVYLAALPDWESCGQADGHDIPAVGDVGSGTDDVLRRFSSRSLFEELVRRLEVER